jgi:hypothetical protein
MLKDKGYSAKILYGVFHDDNFNKLKIKWKRKFNIIYID